MDIKNAYLEATCVYKSQYPEKGLPEIAFVGRSNVGKSSLINALMNRKSLARTSQTPGKTRTINFYNIDEALFFVDLPGYGYASVSKQEAEKWGAMIDGYLTNRAELKAIVMLVDIRHSPTQNDIQMIDWINYHQKPVIIAATKSDKIKRSVLSAHIKEVCVRLSVENASVCPFSSKTKQGKDEILQKIFSYV